MNLIRGRFHERGLVSIRQEIEQGRFQFKPELEDIHTLSYNRDVQEDKEGFFDSVDTLLSTLEVFSGIAARDVIGGTAPRQVDRALDNAKKVIEEDCLATYPPDPLPLIREGGV